MNTMIENNNTLIHISKACLNWHHDECNIEGCECDCAHHVLADDYQEIEKIKQRLRDEGHLMDGSKHCGQC